MSAEASDDDSQQESRSASSGQAGSAGSHQQTERSQNQRDLNHKVTTTLALMRLIICMSYTANVRVASIISQVVEAAALPHEGPATPNKT